MFGRTGKGSVRARLRKLEQRAHRQHERIAELERELGRVSPQLAALEARVEDLRENLGQRPISATAEEHDEARLLLDDVRREHRQVRARISSATVFEERLRVVEDRVGVDSATGRPTSEA